MGPLRGVAAAVVAATLCGGIEYALPNRPRAPEVVESSVTASSVVVRWPPVEDEVALAVDAYEIEAISLQERERGWFVAAADVGLAPATRRRHEVQMVEVRVDRGSRVDSGYFQLYLVYDGVNPLKREPGVTAFSAPLPFDATADEVRVAIAQLTNGGRVKVTRCDGVVRGAGGWLGGCPYGGRGGYSWHVEFDDTDPEKWTAETPALPLLQVYKETISQSGARWTGPGNQVAAWRTGAQGLVLPSLGCSVREWIRGDLPFQAGDAPPGTDVGAAVTCATNITGLSGVRGGLYAFRLKAHSAAGWSAPGPPSRYVRLVADEAPPTPPAPLVATDASSQSLLEAGSAAFHVQTPQTAALALRGGGAAATYVVQYRPAHESESESSSTPWIDGGSVDVSDSPWVTVTLRGLEPGGAVVARTAALNAAGRSHWSAASLPAVAQHAPAPARPERPVVVASSSADTVTVKWRASAAAAAAAAAAGSASAVQAAAYELSMQAWRGEGWTHPYSWIDDVVDPVPATATRLSEEVQAITSRADKGRRISSGHFRIGITVPGAWDRPLETRSLPYDAPGFEVKDALEAIDVLPRGSVSVLRHTPDDASRHVPDATGGYTWRIHLRDVSRIADPNSHFVALLQIKNLDLGDARWSGPGLQMVVSKVSSAMVLAAGPVFEAAVNLLEAETKYRFRVRAVDAQGRASDWSDVSDWGKTAVAAQQVKATASSDLKTSKTVLETARSWRCARSLDPDYVEGACDGGDDGLDGLGGLAVIKAYDRGLAHGAANNEAQAVFYWDSGDPGPRRFVVPSVAPGKQGGFRRVVVKVWGAGGGGAMLPGRGERNATSRNGASPHDALTWDASAARGGGGGFAQATLDLLPGDEVRVVVGGPGRGATAGRGGAGGFNGGAAGGDGEWGGGGGGGGTEVYLGEDHSLVMVAGGGGGGGAADYCCAHGGGGGGLAGAAGRSAGFAATPLLPQGRSPQDDDDSDYNNNALDWSYHGHLDLGAAPGADYATLAAGGRGANQTNGGDGGRSGSYEVAASGTVVEVTSGNQGATTRGLVGGLRSYGAALRGAARKGGRGASGKEAGGGGGGGLYGGGGGGAGVDGAGGGGGSGFVWGGARQAAESSSSFPGEGGGGSRSLDDDAPPAPRLMGANHSAVVLTWAEDDSVFGAVPYAYAERYHVEVALYDASLEFATVAVVNAADGGATIGDLEPSTRYLLRVRSANHTALSAPSATVEVATAPAPVDGWALVRPRAYVPRSEGGYGRAAPVLKNRPHYSVGSLTDFPTERDHRVDDATRLADAPTAEATTKPSPREGHTLTRLGGRADVESLKLRHSEVGSVFLFGGFGDGYDCDGAIGATFRLGSPSAGRDVLRCSQRPGASDELWRFDARLSTWTLIQPGGATTGTRPGPRSRHVAANVRGKLLVFGGRADPVAKNVKGGGSEEASFTSADFLNDLWELDVGSDRRALHRATTMPTMIRSPGVVYMSVSVVEDGGWVVRDLEVRVTLMHPCPRVLTLTLLGPGPSLGDANFGRPIANTHTVTLLPADDTLPCGAADAALDLTFDDGAAADVATTAALPPYTGRFRPLGRLAEFLGVEPTGNWTLQVRDDGYDDGGATAAVVNVALDFRLERHEPEYVWTNLTTNSTTSPPPLAEALGVAVGDQLFIYGGHTADLDEAGAFLFRYDAYKRSWRELTPAVALDARHTVGRAAALTPWGVFAYGGLGPARSGQPTALDDPRLWRLDLWTLRWRRAQASPVRPSKAFEPRRHRVDGEADHARLRALVAAAKAPRARYHAALAYVEAGIVDAVQGAIIAGSLTAPASSSSPATLLLFGGNDFTAHLDDAWFLKLANTSQLDDEREAHCRFRFMGSSQPAWEASCGSSEAPQANPCSVADLLRRAYCLANFQALNNLPF